MAAVSKGNCYICGGEFGKTAIKNHLLKAHAAAQDGQPCRLLKIEGAYNKAYWLYVDIPLTSTLDSLDGFMRSIWLECCGHLSAFFGRTREEISLSRKLGSFAEGDKLSHEYDFGSTTETLITVMGDTVRKKQRQSVRLLARNVPPSFACRICGQPAARICTECMYGEDDAPPFFCEDCADGHEHGDMFLPVVNSPRMGTCGYDGELDVFAFDAGKLHT